MTCNKRKLNDDRTEAMTVGTRLVSGVSFGEHLKVGDYEVPFKLFVKTLGVFLDSSLTMSKQVSNLIMLHLFLKKKKKNTLASNETENIFQNCNVSLQTLQQHFTLLPVSQAYCLYTC